MMKGLLRLLAPLALAACNLDTPAPVNQPSDPATETFAASLGVNISQMQKVAVGSNFVYYKDFTVGSGAVLKSAVPVIVTYAGFLSNGALFDSGNAVQFNLAQTVIGFQQGMLGMNVGGERLIVVPSNLGYGPYAIGRVPANSTLVFDVRLENIP